MLLIPEQVTAGTLCPLAQEGSCAQARQDTPIQRLAGWGLVLILLLRKLRPRWLVYTPFPPFPITQF